jgi:3D-(3,5/4)-trihydroxycyclohexane-1,2-dione acylhydrolase (decyclizing)
VIIVGGGVLYSEASEALSNFVSATGIPIGETYAGKGASRIRTPCVSVLSEQPVRLP